MRLGRDVQVNHVDANHIPFCSPCVIRFLPLFDGQGPFVLLGMVILGYSLLALGSLDACTAAVA